MNVAVVSSMIPNEPAHGANGSPLSDPPEPLSLDARRDKVVPISLDEQVRAFEARLITWALTACGGNKSKAARLLNIKRSTLGDRIHRCGLDGTTGSVSIEERR
jgi:DNA-binding NtrC family response regulator